jgi:hypothetical protein
MRCSERICETQMQMQRREPTDALKCICKDVNPLGGEHWWWPPHWWWTPLVVLLHKRMKDSFHRLLHSRSRRYLLVTLLLWGFLSNGRTETGLSDRGPIKMMIGEDTIERNDALIPNVILTIWNAGTETNSYPDITKGSYGSVFLKCGEKIIELRSKYYWYSMVSAQIYVPRTALAPLSSLTARLNLKDFMTQEQFREDVLSRSVRKEPRPPDWQRWITNCDSYVMWYKEDELELESNRIVVRVNSRRK